MNLRFTWWTLRLPLVVQDDGASEPHIRKHVLLEYEVNFGGSSDKADKGKDTLSSSINNYQDKCLNA